MIDFNACPRRLPGVPVSFFEIVPDLRPNTDLVRHLGMLLAQAESGELRSMVAVGVYTRHRTTHGFDLECYGDGVLVLGKMEEAKTRVLEWMARQ